MPTPFSIRRRSTMFARVRRRSAVSWYVATYVPLEPFVPSVAATGERS
jgi:hypothetical protein